MTTRDDLRRVDRPGSSPHNVGATRADHDHDSDLVRDPVADPNPDNVQGQARALVQYLPQGALGRKVRRLSNLPRVPSLRR